MTSEVEETSRNAPPAYGDEEPVDFEAVSAAFYRLDLAPSGSLLPSADRCLAHLKLLFAFENLKERVGRHDGLWQIWDSRAHNAAAARGNNAVQADVLAKLREKRWAVYIARAVDRYEAWWNSFVPDMLHETDMLTSAPGKSMTEARKPSKYETFTKENVPVEWTSAILPPLDVLLVWHTHMLNPRLFLEDCLRYGYGSLWSGGMPWAVINDVVDLAFHFAPPEAAKASWIERTGRAWNNEDDPETKHLRCPKCSTWHSIKWTTCGQEQDAKSPRKPGLVGQGYGDGQFNFTCDTCALMITEDILRVSKFVNGVKSLVSHGLPMPGTVLNTKDGVVTTTEAEGDQLFPGRLVREGLLADVLETFDTSQQTSKNIAPSMIQIRDEIQRVTGPTTYRHSTAKLRKVDKGTSGIANISLHKLSLAARVQTRNMMSRYWENYSSFGLDLRGAVMRQGVFAKKMRQLDWLHSPVAKFTMEKLLTKYIRFFEIAAEHPNKVVVPTLDVDLAWHTHQLNPQEYYAFTVSKTGAFTDHNDKVDEDKLGVSFDWMSKTYQDKYGEVYSECTCWFCETLRFMHSSPRGAKFFGTNKPTKVVEEWRASGKAHDAPQPPAEESAHISSHPATKATNETNMQRRRQRWEFHNNIDDAYEKALKQANKQLTKSPLLHRATYGVARSVAAEKSIIGPRGEDRCDHWGKQISLDGPWSSQVAAALTAEMYAVHPGHFHTKPGDPGVCAAGTCGGSAGCGSGAVALCGAGCTGMGQNFFGAGCTGRGTGS